MRAFPPLPAVPAEQSAEGAAVMRYEDVCQDGRVLLVGLPHAYGEVLFRKLLAGHPVANAMRTTGIFPILSRLLLEGTGEPLSVTPSVQVRGSFELAKAPDGQGGAERVFLNLWADVSGPRDRLVGPPSVGRGEVVVAGRVFAEHTFTRLFAPPEARKVQSLEGLPGVPAIPEADYVPERPDALLGLPDGARWIDEAARPDDAFTAFTLSHTDSNQHVNSLVYPTLFDEAVARRLASLGRRTDVLARQLEIAFRKPFFAGDRARVLLRTFESGDLVGASGAFFADGADPATARPHAVARAYFSR